ncbi:hypothetical protein QO005_001930 [Rhizobium paknamense]|uniref:Aa3-type cytochrome c oxidase subunit IV n=1 Tax=Rhizobium paknamense TaxID=1206817 RepID=A0ABU0IBJ9_9HYPH|nr:hypothetical protein [Rhizobium paknamense]
MRDPQQNPIWDRAFGGDTAKGTVLFMAYMGLFVLVGATLVFLLGPP